MKNLIHWKLEDIALNMIEYPEQEKDCSVGISGEEGDGKSVVSRLLTRIQYKEWLKEKFVLKNCLFYGKDSLKKAMERDHKRIFIHDEAIDNFNRTFYEKTQIDFVKMLKVVRDHHHIFYQNIPILWELDPGIRKRIRIYLYIHKCVNLKTHELGIVYIFKKRRGAFVTDPWFVQFNQKLELRGSITSSPNFYGYMTIPWLGDQEWFLEMEEEARRIKDEKRAEVTKEEKFKLEPNSAAYTVQRLKDSGLLGGTYKEISQYLGLDYGNFRNCLSDVANKTIIIHKKREKTIIQPTTEVEE